MDETLGLALLLQQTAAPSGTSVLVSYIPILMMLAMAGGLAVILLTTSRLIGQKKPTKEKLMPYECGKDPVGSARERHSVRFFIVAMIFLLFDIEVAFLYPWAMAIRDLRWMGFIQVLVFFMILVAGYAYVWKKRALDWDRP